VDGDGRGVGKVAATLLVVDLASLAAAWSNRDRSSLLSDCDGITSSGASPDSSCDTPLKACRCTEADIKRLSIKHDRSGSAKCDCAALRPFRALGDCFRARSYKGDVTLAAGGFPMVL